MPKPLESTLVTGPLNELKKSSLSPKSKSRAFAPSLEEEKAEEKGFSAATIFLFCSAAYYTGAGFYSFDLGAPPEEKGSTTAAEYSVSGSFLATF